MAPCVQDDIWTLALCKPRIRSSAQAGDYVVAIWTASLYGTGYIHSVARIGRADSLPEYYGHLVPTRRDQIYRADGNGAIHHRGNVKYHAVGAKADEQQRKDAQGRVLVSEHFATFAASDPPRVSDYEHLREIAHSGIGQRKDRLTSGIAADLEHLVGRGNSRR
jgi:hypothetical protein